MNQTNTKRKYGYRHFESKKIYLRLLSDNVLMVIKNVNPLPYINYFGPLEDIKFPLRAAFKLKLVFYIYINVIMSLIILLLTISSALWLLKKF